MGRNLKRVKKPYKYIVLGGKPSKPTFQGGSKTLTGAMKKLPKSGKGGIAQISKAWEFKKPKKKQRKRRKSRKKSKRRRR